MARKRYSYGTLPAFVLAFALGCRPGPENVEALERVAEEPRAVAGETVTVEGRVSLVLSECAFELEDADPLSPERVLTLCEPAGLGETPPEVPAGVAKDDWLRVTGVAGEMTRSDCELRAALTLPDEVFKEQETRPVILIERAEKIPEPEPNEARLPRGPVVVPVL